MLSLRPSLYFVLPLLLASPAAALTITTADGVGADAYVRWTDTGPEPDTNYGAATTVRTKDPQFPGVGNTRKAYLRFDLAALGGASVTAAELQLTFSGADPGDVDSNLRLWGLPDGDPGEGWGEDTLTWNNAPRNNQDSNTTSGTFLANFVRPADTPVLDVLSVSSTDLVTFLNADSDGQVTLMITGTGASGLDGIFNAFNAKESTAGGAPTLELTVPEPSGAALLSLGVLALSALQPRRNGIRGA